MIDLKLLEDELKCAITQCLYDFTDKYAAPGSDFYPHVLPTMKKVLLESYAEVKRQSGERIVNESNAPEMALLLGFAHGSINSLLPIAFNENSSLYPKLMEINFKLGKWVNEVFYEAEHE